MKLNSKIVLIFIFLLILVASSFYSIFLFSSKVNKTDDSLLNELVTVSHNINVSSVIKHVEYFSSLGSRVTGYQGSQEAASYIYQKFLEYGLSNVSYQYYNVTVPIDYGTSIVVHSKEDIKLPAYSVWPNGVAATFVNVTGNLVYARSGEWEDFNGKKINGSIVMLDFNSQNHWLRAAELGAKAVIFIEPNDTSTYESNLKKLNYLPLVFPRVYVNKTEASLLLSILSKDEIVTVSISSNMTYEKRMAKNIIGFVNGVDPDPSVRDQIVILFAHYDSFSVVPAVAPGAGEAFGIATLLELAKFYAKNPLPRTLMFVAFSGDGENVLGSREFMGNIVWKEENLTLASRFVSALGFDITPENNKVALGFSFIGSQDVYNWYSAYYQEFISNMSVLWQSLYGNASVSSVEGYPGQLPTMISPVSLISSDASDADLLGRTGIPTSFIYTAHCWYSYRGTPIDTLSKYGSLSSIENNLKPQLEAIFSNVYLLAHSLPTKIMQPFSVSFARYPRGATVVQGGGFGLLVGQIVEYNMTSGWFVPVANSIVLVRPALGSSSYVTPYVTFTDKNGTFYYFGAIPIQRANYPYIIEAYVIDKSTNNIVYGPDFGSYTSSYNNIIQIPIEGNLGSFNHPRPFVIFKGSSIALYSILATQPLSSSLGFYSTQIQFVPTTVQASISVNDIRTHAPPDHYSFIVEGSTALVFSSPSIPIEIIVRSQISQAPLLILTNASENYPEGYGFRSSMSHQISITNSPFKYAKNLYELNTFRLLDAHSKNLHTGGEDYHIQAANALQEASDALNNYQYNLFYTKSIEAWTLERQVYQLTMDSINGAISTTTFFYALLIPFAFVSEGLLFSYSDTSKKFLAMSLIFFLLLGVLFVFHPGFELASSIYVSLLGLTILIFILPVTLILVSNALNFLKEIRIKLIGEHYAGVSKGSAILTSFNIGVSQMKKRKLRTALTIVSLIITTSSFVMFTSLYPYTVIKGYPKVGQAFYQGIYLRDLMYSSLNVEFLGFLKAKFNSSVIVSPRAVLYPPSSLISSGFNLFSESNSTLKARVFAVYGVTSEEGNIVGWSKFLLDGSWFNSCNTKVAILPDTIAKKLNVKVGDEVSLEGLPLTVVGILNSDEADKILDLDQNPATPRDLRVITGIGFFSTKDILFVPYDLAVALGGNFYAATITFKNVNQIQNATLSLAKQVNLQIYATSELGNKSEIYLYSIAKGVESYGYSMFFLPLAILSLVIIDMVLSTVFERSKEIGVLGAVGLSPLHIIGLFLGEIVTYALVSAVIGYAVGIVLLQVLIHYGSFLPIGFYPNYSSYFAVITVSVIMLAVLVPSLYPLYQASKMVTPSLERKWSIPTKPIGNQWVIPIPFVFLDELEVHGVLMFILEYFKTFTIEGSGMPFVIKSASFEETSTNQEKIKQIVTTMHIAPFPAGINQELRVTISFSPKENRWFTTLNILKLTGQQNLWEKSNYVVADAIRKQFLQWRGLPPEMKRKYMVGKDE
ncbi:MAG: FtsX-like permease family protein [Thermoproteota archaeon]